MPIEFWMFLWKFVLIISLILFAGLAIVVTIGGAGDIRRLFQALRDEHARNSAENTSEDGERVFDNR